MAKDAKKAADEAAPKDDRDDVIAALQLELEEAKKAADEAARIADQAKRDEAAARSEIASMVEAGAKRPVAAEPRVLRARLRDPRVVGLNIRGTNMDGEFRAIDVTGCSAKQIDDLIADPLLEVERT